MHLDDHRRRVGTDGFKTHRAGTALTSLQATAQALQQVGGGDLQRFTIRNRTCEDAFNAARQRETHRVKRLRQTTKRLVDAAERIARRAAIPRVAECS